MTKKLNSICFFILFIFLFNSVVLGATIDDVRDLLGIKRVDDIYTQSEMDLIIKQYNEIEQANLTLRMLEMGKELRLDDETIAEYDRLQQELVIAKEELAKSFQNGSPIEEVLKKKSTVESIIYKIESLRDLGVDIKIEYIPNIWEERYNEVQNIVKQLNSQYDLGEVGTEMDLPIDYGFYMLSPFGFRMNRQSNDYIEEHNGIDFNVKNNTFVLAQWNGIVSNVYNDENGIVIEVSHGSELKTIYKHLSSSKVNIGTEVKQYQVIGNVGENVEGVETHLHFGIYLDNEYVNPIYLYGQKGLNAFKVYVSDNPYYSLDLETLEIKLKMNPTKEVVEKEEDEIDSLIAGNKPTVGFDGKVFSENIWKFPMLSPEEERELQKQKEKEEKEKQKELNEKENSG